MTKQLVNGYLVEIKSSSELGGFPITGERDAAIIEVYDCGSLIGEVYERGSLIGEETPLLIDSAWLTISRNGVARLERIK